MSGPRLVNWLLPLTLGTLLTYWAWQLYAGLSHSLRHDLPDLGGLARYLAGIALLLLLIWALAHGNYRFAFRRWLGAPTTNAYYWLWLCGLAGILFELWQLRTEHDPEFVDENLLVTLLLTGFIIAYGYVADAVRSRQDRLLLMQQKAEAELMALKAQVNPHFLFNALNTIYNEAQLADNETVADQIQQLSGLMRYVLQESHQAVTWVERELEFLEKYIALQRARLPRTNPPRLSVRLESDGQPTPIAPLLLIPFVENAFQHGVSPGHPSFIEIDIEVEDRELNLRIRNSVVPHSCPSQGAGTGIANARQRLALTYPNRHQLTIQQTDTVFDVTLTISL